MSLINDALKKAQRQRTGDASPTSQPPMPGSPVAPTRPLRTGNNSNPQLVLVGAGAVLGLVIAGGAFFLFRSKPATETGPVNSPPPAVAEAAPANPADTATVTATLATTSPTVFSAKTPEPVIVVKTEIAPGATAATSLSSETPSVAEKTVATPAGATASATPSEPPSPSLRMIESIEALRVAGIRVGAGTGADAKVLMNDRVYRIGDTVDHALAIKLTGVTASSLTFRDPTGATYTRNF